MPQIVKATVAKAKEGSLIHTKWLWGVMEKNMPRQTTAEQQRAKASLAELLMEQLPGGLGGDQAMQVDGAAQMAGGSEE
ncbi:hypothetical protein [Acidipila sp. EB88]|uniref:hypothetical protein n=1 Tax=Acidipila sp. EB88 TaxID=2305226 RepID=UPI000F5FA738|nr:hypothetical protein [Acidipila sp. EB88]